jgi:DNA-binding LacI/PurR family transcriptional regulator
MVLKTPTLEEPAKVAGAPRSIISRTTSDQSNPCAEARQRVWRIMSEMEYHSQTAVSPGA